MGWGRVVVLQVLFSTVIGPALEQVIQTRYGALGMLGLGFTVVGIKARNATCTSIGAVFLALLLAQA